MTDGEVEAEPNITDKKDLCSQRKSTKRMDTCMVGRAKRRPEDQPLYQFIDQITNVRRAQYTAAEDNLWLSPDNAEKSSAKLRPQVLKIIIKRILDRPTYYSGLGFMGRMREEIFTMIYEIVPARENDGHYPQDE